MKGSLECFPLKLFAIVHCFYCYCRLKSTDMSQLKFSSAKHNLYSLLSRQSGLRTMRRSGQGSRVWMFKTGAWGHVLKNVVKPINWKNFKYHTFKIKFCSFAEFSMWDACGKWNCYYFKTYHRTAKINTFSNWCINEL